MYESLKHRGKLEHGFNSNKQSSANNLNSTQNFTRVVRKVDASKTVSFNIVSMSNLILTAAATRIRSDYDPTTTTKLFYYNSISRALMNTNGWFSRAGAGVCWSHVQTFYWKLVLPRFYCL